MVTAGPVPVLAVRFLCLVLFVSSTFTLAVTWKSAVTFLALLGSCVVLKSQSGSTSTRDTNGGQKRTRDIVRELYPSKSESDLEHEAATAIYKLVSYDTEHTTSLENFDVLKQNSNCVFARKAKLWGSPDWNRRLSVEDNISRLLPMFLKFTIVCASQRLDGYLLELPGDLFGGELQTFGVALLQVLTAISDRDPAGYYCMNKSFVGKRGWVFEFNKMTFFITTFAPFYPESHPRYSFGCPDCYILFQPELSFTFHDLPEDTPGTNWESPETVRDRIRVAFKTAGRPYYIPESVYSPMAQEILRPVHDHDPLFEWWNKQ